MPISRRIAALLAAAALGVPATALAQTATIPSGRVNISNTPPVPLSGSGPAVSADELPNTGTDPRLLFLCGIALTLLGVGLRLRTADAELY
ncbi:MAG: hypothetical protein QOD69_2798 [Solirubrobacteraceae bacterium]|nr:hypothetical protein [Solirubrobacteraceae bacterium]